VNSLSPEFLDRQRFGSGQLATLRALGEHRGRQILFDRQTPKTLADLVEAAVVESTESSTRLEGIVVSRSRIRALVLEGTAPRSRSEQEVAGYRDALALIHKSGRDMPVSANVVRQLHTRLYRYLPQPGGEWKATDNDIVETAADGPGQQHGRVRFAPVAANLTPDAMRRLVEGYDLARDRHLADPLILVPLTVLDFLCVHPFPDGNGRMARLITLQLLYNHDYRVGRYISLERILEDTRVSYHETLEASSQGWHEARHDVMPWLDYFWGVLLRAYGEFEERVGTIERGRGSKSERVRREALSRTLPFSISSLEEACPGISRETVRLVLRALRKEGLIASTGKGRGAKWQRTDGTLARLDPQNPDHD